MNAGIPSISILRARAAAVAGSEDFGPDDGWVEGFDVLHEALCSEARLGDERTASTTRQLVGLLANRARWMQAVAADPSIKQRPVVAPVVIVGLPRTGTTMLHNLLARHPELRGPKLWEMQHPLGPDGHERAAWEEGARAQSQQMLDMLYRLSPGFRAVHAMGVDQPDECSFLLRHSFTTLVYGLQYRVPSYADWLAGADHVSAYRTHKALLQVLSVPGDRRRWVLKDPCHLWHLDALFEVYPDARVVLTHRAVAEAVPSMASLCHALWSLQGGPDDRVEVGRWCVDMAERALVGLSAARRSLDQANVIHVDYRALVNDPETALRQLARDVGVDAGDAAIGEMTAWLGEHRQGAHGAHRYAARDFGLDADDLRQRFSWYERSFGLREEAA